LVLGLALAFAFPALLHAQGLLIINSAQADLSANTIAVSGVNFGSTHPTVNLDAMQFAVTPFSPTAIQAKLPAWLGPGWYHSVVTNFSTSPRASRDRVG
jgi:hypothetical protein